MTRRGSLAYYLAAWICGCFFMTALVWLKEMAGAMPLLFYLFFGLIFGAFASLVGAFLLRRIATAFRWTQAWQWTLAGAVLAPAFIGVLGAWWRRVMWHPRAPPPWLSLMAFGPSLVLDKGLWLAIPAGAATAIVLYRIHRAFAPLPESPGESPGR